MLRATLKSLLARKLRLLLSTLAVVLSVMFVAGSYVLTDTVGRSFDNLFANIYTYTDIEVSAEPEVGGGFSAPVPPPIRPETVARIAGTEGVAKADGQVFANGARPLTESGKLVANATGQRFGASWEGENELVKLTSGGAPRSETDIVVNGDLATARKVGLGDKLDVITPFGQRQTFTVAGVFEYAGGRGTLAGESTIFFTEPTAQKLMIGEPDTFNIVDVDATSGTDLNALRDRLQSQLGGGFKVQTGPELAKASAAPFKTIFNFINYVLLGFGGVALLVGVFLILNTFSIIVAQRTRELALLRAMGASRGQMMGSVLLEAVLIGLIGSAVGFAIGVGIGYVGALGLSSIIGGIELASVGIPWSAPVLSFAIGLTVTVVAAILPALRAARVAPVAAMREAATADRPLTRITIAGGVVTAGAVTALIFGLNGAGSTTTTLSLIFGGVLGILIGTALLTPLLARPVVGLLGRVFSWSVPGKLGRLNSGRNPRRTAITAAAVMIGIALVTAISTVFSSLSASLNTIVDQQVKADLIVYGQQTSEIVPTVKPPMMDAITALPDVATTAGFTADGAKINGKDTAALTYDDFPAAVQVLQISAVQGSVSDLQAGQVVVNERQAKSDNLKLGDQVRIQLPNLAEKPYTLTAILKDSAVSDGYTISYADAQQGFRSVELMQVMVKLRDGANVTAAKAQIEKIIADDPEIVVQTRKEYIGNSTQVFDLFLGVVQVLLLVAIAISVLGVINTLVLSVLERTRELGVLRAIGLKRGQTMRMITVESVVISLFGTILGLAVGVGIGAAVVNALREQVGFGEFTPPIVLMVVYLVAALIIGVVAAILPAVRAARLNVLGAIAYE